MEPGLPLPADLRRPPCWNTEMWMWDSLHASTLVTSYCKVETSGRSDRMKQLNVRAPTAPNDQMQLHLL